jgi:hypothetical protein
MNARSDVVDSARCLVETWTKRARQALECGDRTDDPMGKRLVEHGGVIYANCAMEMERVLNATAQRGFVGADGCREGAE